MDGRGRALLIALTEKSAFFRYWILLKRKRNFAVLPKNKEGIQSEYKYHHLFPQSRLEDNRFLDSTRMPINTCDSAFS